MGNFKENKKMYFPNFYTLEDNIVQRQYYKSQDINNIADHISGYELEVFIFSVGRGGG